MILFINACVRARSRTKRLADALIGRLDGPVTEIRLSEMRFPVMDEATLNRRDRLLETGNLSDSLFGPARQFAAADRIVVAAPYWDLSFPAALKQYFEQINVPGLTFRYTEDGMPQGLCRAGQLFYVTTAGGSFVPEEYGFGYVRALAQGFYGIQDVRLIRACGLDLDGADPERILLDAIRNLDDDLQ